MYTRSCAKVIAGEAAVIDSPTSVQADHPT